MNYALENGMIDLSYVREKIEMNKREELIKKHPYEIWEGKDGNWHTYFPSDKDRIHRKRKNKSDLYDLIVDYWKQETENPTVGDIFYEWLDKKLDREEITKSTRDRYIRQFEECFVEFGARRIKTIEEGDIEDFVLDIIPQCKLTVKGFGNLRTLLYGIFKYAKKRHYVDFSITSVMQDIEISRKSFRKVVKEDEELVFMEDELPKIMSELLENQDIVNLGILLLFKTGMRIGELVALRPENIKGNVIEVRATEICYEENGERIFEVRNFPKTEAGIRDIVIPKKDVWILQKIRYASPFGEYLFEVNGNRMLAHSFRTRLHTVCKHANVRSKSPNKIRKTYGSILIDSGVEESVVISQMGHTDIKTTKGHYYRNRKSIEQKQEEMSKVQFL